MKTPFDVKRISHSSACLAAAEGPAPAATVGLHRSHSAGTGVVSVFDGSAPIKHHVECRSAEGKGCFVDKGTATMAARGRRSDRGAGGPHPTSTGQGTGASVGPGHSPLPGLHAASPQGRGRRAP